MTTAELLRCLAFESLRLAEGDRLAIVCDDMHREEGERLGGELVQIGLDSSLHLTAFSGGPDLEPDLAARLLDEPHVPCLFLVEDKTVWHTGTRIRGKGLGKRFSTFLCPLHEMSAAGTHINSTLIRLIGGDLAPMFKRGAEVRITSPSGTNLTAQVGYLHDSRPFCETGDYSAKGGDFPFGECGFAPELGTVSGVLVYDWKVKHFGVVEQPLTLVVEADRVVSVGGESSERFKQTNLFDDALWNVAEISMGLNPTAGFSPDPSHIIEEKQLGSVHFGHGSNGSYGMRKVGPHWDGVIRNASLSVDGTTVVEAGRIVRRYLKLLDSQLPADLVTA